MSDWTTRFATRSLRTVLGLSLVLSSSQPLPARAELDAAAIGNGVSALGTTMMTIAIIDSMGSGASCSCVVSTGTECPKGVAMMCGMMGLNILVAIASLIPIGSGQDTAASVAGGTPNLGELAGFDPDQPLAGLVGCPNGSPACDCSGPSASMNILCGRGSLENVKAQLGQIATDIQAGTLPIPDGQTPEGLLSSIQDANAGLDSLLNGQIPGVESASIGDSIGGGKSSGGGKAGTEILGGGFDTSFANGAGPKKAGPADRAGLGKISLINGLDAIDEETGKSLTIWQRLSRRTQGDEQGSRSFLMAKIEAMRKQASKKQPATLASSKPIVPAPRAPTSAVPKVPPASDVLKTSQQH
jgi:hypothetical protein